jgi:imidazolonepropionase-like amidohydrolase
MSSVRLAVCALFVAATWPARSAQVFQSAPPTLFEGARLIVDARRPPIQNSAFVVANGRIVSVGRKGAIRVPPTVQRVDLSGKTVMPAIVDTHVHLGYQVGLQFAAENFTRATLVDELNRYAYAGIAAVLSLGTEPGPLPAQLRAEQSEGRVGGARFLTAGRGIAAPNAGPGTPELKSAAYGVTTDDEARRAVREQIDQRVDFIKIWVDDRNGTVPKLSPALYRAVIDEAHKRGTRVVAHVFYLDDAKDLARAGVDAFAHLVRDKEMDAELVALIRKQQIVVMPNMAISENGTQAEAPAWLDDPLLHDVAPAAVIDRVRNAYAQRPPEAVAPSKATYGVMERSMAALNAAGVRLALGTDDGAVRDHFYAFTAHRELQLLTRAGLKAARALDVATRESAEFLRLTDLGTLEPGKRADFIVLDANPLDDIVNTRKIAAVYMRGEAIDRAALRASWK